MKKKLHTTFEELAKWFGQKGWTLMCRGKGKFHLRKRRGKDFRAFRSLPEVYEFYCTLS